MYCKICGKHLYETIDMRTIFKWNYTVHVDCKKLLEVEWQFEVIPIDDNEINNYYLYDKNMEIDIDYIWNYKVLEILETLLKVKDWSILYFYDEVEYQLLPNIDVYLLLQLNKKKIVFISVFLL